MNKFDPRVYMEQAIAAMRDSIEEPRADGKATPKVGAVLVDLDPDTPQKKRITSAYRGELRHGDHAEFTLLERKNRDRKLDGCILFATLEPCAPQARKLPKLGCAERIVLARIKKVWIGIEDPDPAVDRKGIKYLQDNGVEVHMFDHDLQEIIRNENIAFLEQALERASNLDKQTPDVILSPLENAIVHARLDDFSPGALEAYRERAGIAEELDSSEFHRRLLRQNLLKQDGKNLIPTGFGTLLFGREPRTSMPQAGLLATIHYASGSEEARDFDGPHVSIPEDVLSWLKDKLPNVMDRSQAIRASKGDVIFGLVREGVVNALIHRDYGILEAKCQLIVTSEKIEIRSPGLPVPPIRLEQLQSFQAPMLSRNPVLHYVFAKMGIAEERGLGLKSLRHSAEETGLPLPRYSWAPPYLSLTLFRDRAAAREALPQVLKDVLSPGELMGFEWLSTKGRTKSTDYARALRVDVRSARRHLSHFAELELVNTIGSGPATEYEVKQ